MIQGNINHNFHSISLTLNWSCYSQKALSSAEAFIVLKNMNSKELKLR